MIVNMLAAGTFDPFVSAWKVLPAVIVLLIWTRLLTWVDKDAQKALLPRQGISAGMVVALLLGILLLFMLPGFGLAIGVFVVLFLASMGAYLAIRGQKIGLGDLQDELMGGLSSLIPAGRSKKDKGLVEIEGQVVLIGKNGQPVTQPEAEDPYRLAYDLTQLFLVEPMNKQATTIDIAAGSQQAGSRYWIDGVSYDGTTQDRNNVLDVVAYLKALANLDPEERRKPQAGTFKILREGKRHEVRLLTAGTRDGERATLEIDVPARYQFRPSDVGFTTDQLARLEAAKDEPGVILLAAPKGHGLTAMQYAMARMHDAFTSHILTVERDPPIELEGITQNKLPANVPPAEEAKQVAWVASQEPDILLVGLLETPQAARAVIDLVKAGKRVYVTIRAGDVFEAIDAWKKVVGDDRLAVSELRTVLAGRLFRRLCDATKMPYQPDERMLKQLGLSANQVSELYKPHFGNLVDARGNEVPDTFCFGLGYRGRFGVYEMFDLSDEAKQAYASGASLNALRQLFRKQKGRYLQELAVARVAAGDTSVQEFLRVLKPGSDESSQKPAKAPTQA